METWKQVGEPYRTDYEVSDLGRVRRRDGVICCQTRCATSGGAPGYMKVSLMLAGPGRIRKYVSVHRLVALAFIPTDLERPDVNHKDMNKVNNVLANLEWVTHGENIRHGLANHPDWKKRLKVASLKLRKPVIATPLDGSSEEDYASLNDAGRAMGDRTRSANIKHAIDLGGHVYGRRWRYKHGRPKRLK